MDLVALRKQLQAAIDKVGPVDWATFHGIAHDLSLQTLHDRALAEARTELSKRGDDVSMRARALLAEYTAALNQSSGATRA
jgi:hypothetical protein